MSELNYNSDDDLLFCPACLKNITPQCKEVIFRNNTKHLEARCPDCGKYLKYISRVNNSNKIIYFGKYRGKKMSEIPEEYLKWLLTTGIQNNLRKTIEDCLNKF